MMTYEVNTAKLWENYAREDVYSNSTFDDTYYVAFGEAMKKLAGTNSGSIRLCGSRWAAEGPASSEDRVFYRAWFWLHNLPGFRGYLDPCSLGAGMIYDVAMSFRALDVIDFRQFLLLSSPTVWEEGGWANYFKSIQNPDGSIPVFSEETA